MMRTGAPVAGAAAGAGSVVPAAQLSPDSGAAYLNITTEPVI